MKHPYVGIWFLLSLSLIIFITISYLDPITVCGYELKRAGFCEEFTKQIPENNQPYLTNTLLQKDKIDTKVEKRITNDTLPKSILFIGDSMLEGLMPRLASYSEKNGHKLNAVIWYSSTTKNWGRSDTIRHFIRKFKPNYIFICLGANELFVKDIIKKRQNYVSNILKQIGDIPYVWIGPPNWKEDTGINTLISTNTKDGTFFLSKNLKFERSKDGAHPTRKSSAAWMDSVVSWITTEGHHPIRLNKPDKLTARSSKTVILQPEK